MSEQVKFAKTIQTKYDALVSSNSVDSFKFYFCEDTNNFYLGKIILSDGDLKNRLFPIGKIEVFFDNEDHSNYLGFKWERCLQGRVPVGIDSDDTDFNAISKQVGEKTHKLTVDEMPSHDHSYRFGGTVSGSNVAVGWHALTIDDPNKSPGINSTGGDQPHNNIQPSEVVAFWKRIS